MGFIVDEPDGSKIHGEARRESFVVYTDWGDTRVELDWSEFNNLKYIIAELEKQCPIDLKVKIVGDKVEFDKEALMKAPLGKLIKDITK